MSRLIDADALKDKLQQHHDFYVMAWGGFGKMPIGEKKRVDEITNCIAEVVNAPTIDAVEVVRCKDCKDIFFDDWYKCFSCANLYGLNEEVKPDDFCSHGERKESE